MNILRKLYRIFLPERIRSKIQLGEKIIDIRVKKLPEYAYGFLEPCHVKIKLHLHDSIQRRIYFNLLQEEEDALKLLSLFKDNGIFFDIGANIGLYSFLFHKKASKVYAFEATKTTYDHLCETIKENNIINITAVFSAVHNTDNEEIVIYSDFSNDDGGNSLHIAPGKMIANKVLTLTIDEFVISNKINQIDIIKIDIEGNELNAFKGMSKTVLRLRPIILCEINPEASRLAQSSVNELFSYVVDTLKYRGYILRYNGNFKEIDLDYINNINRQINCYFFPI